MKHAGEGRIWVTAAIAAVILCVLTGPFGTGALPVATRSLVWAALISVNAMKWWAWYRYVAPRAPPGAGQEIALAGAGALLLNATLPLEVAFVYRAVGLEAVFGWTGVWLVAAAISLVISVVIAVSMARTAGEEAAAPSALAKESAAELQGGLGRKADLGSLMAVMAEDHYLRLHMANGDRPLILYRFGDALADLAGQDGLQVHRSAWVAARAVAGAEREKRRWWLRLSDGTRVPVSARHLPSVKARGWLGRT